MKSKEKAASVISRLEIIVAALLFFAMLVSCGLYINIKMNGKISSLPSIPEKEKRILLKAVASESVVYKDDLLEPVFVGFKNGNSRICAAPDDVVRKSIETTVYDSVINLFSGEHEKHGFESTSEAYDYIEGLKNSDTYMLISFFCDIPSSVILTCVSQNYDTVQYNGESFPIMHLFLLPDIDNNMYGVAVSASNEINIMYPKESVSFDKIAGESYDISDGYSYFEYEQREGVFPVMSSSLRQRKYSVEPSAVAYGKEKNESWVNNIFDVFDINTSLVRNFLSGDKSEINYIDETAEIVINDNGSVVFTNTETEGIYLEEFLGYFPENGNAYTVNDKIFAVKNIVNELKTKSDISSYSMSGIDYDRENDVLSVYLKLFVDGIVVTDSEYDARFEIVSNSLSRAQFSSFVIKRIDDFSILIPQKYANALHVNDADVYCPKLCDTKEANIKTVKWAGFSSSLSEVNS